MLKDAISELVAKKNTTFNCKLGKIICAQDQETQDLLIQSICGDDITTTDIARLLKAEGFPVGREFLGRQRRDCFKQATTPANCCIVTKLEAFKNENK